MPSANSRHCAAVEVGSSVRTTNGAQTQRKNAANKLQHSGLATVVVYHIRHRVLHHIDIVTQHRRYLWISEVNLTMTISPPYPTVGLILRSRRASRLHPPTRRGQGYSGRPEFVVDFG